MPIRVKVLPNPEDAAPLKAILAYDALVDPNHPLRLPGSKGIELSIGTLLNGEARLLFSSAQVEYVRYWLHAMGLTKELLPLPYSDCLLTASSLQHYSPVVYSDAFALRSAIKLIDKNNKRLKGTDTNVTARRLVFERIRSLWAEKRGVWCALDFEAWDRDHTVLTEFGWSLTKWEDGKEIEEMGHLVVKEHQHYTNTYVPNHGKSYNFGTSEIVTRGEFKECINTLLNSLVKQGPFFLVFHDNNQDIKYLRSSSIDAELPNLWFSLPDSCDAALKTPEPMIYVVDTADLFAALEGRTDKRGLERVCRHLQIRTEFLHNAGNDARYTHLALASMASGDPLDMQREKRWPNHTQPANANGGMRVKFSRTEEDSDATADSDDEDWITGRDGPYDPVTGILKGTNDINVTIGTKGVSDVNGKPVGEVNGAEKVNSAGKINGAGKANGTEKVSGEEKVNGGEEVVTAEKTNGVEKVNGAEKDNGAEQADDSEKATEA
ncbi:hypothetical protein EVG20_g5938 [Dentipellis fragilis]|uniref:Gfd2/YDR514C-like C-terminal domain-containing protein n=1 Tax=Dentipellis fragilis TaxID=205917 RepID=A0A4Y9YQQ5_9AGAM|nr:hypothetical protein EVG20_g5938 [Dentipellis fragilis]